MGTLNELIEKKDILAYIEFRGKEIYTEFENIKKHTPELREKIKIRIAARGKELKRLGTVIKNNKLKEESKTIYRHLNKGGN